MIAQVSGRLAAKQGDRVVVHTAGGVGYEIAVPLGVMEQLPPVGESVSLATELVVREDGWALYGFRDESERRFFQRLIGVTGIGPKLAIAHYAPATVKKTVAGAGGAPKAQVGAVVARLLKLKQAPTPADAADGVAVALTHILRA